MRSLCGYEAAQGHAQPTNIMERGRAHLQSLVALSRRTVWEWKRCSTCGGSHTNCWGGYKRHPWFVDGRQIVRVQRHMCYECHKTYSEQSALLVRGSGCLPGRSRRGWTLRA
jgi:hypothetical protein